MRNHQAYSQLIVEELRVKSELSWHAATSILVNKFGWTHKTASNRIHELIDIGVLKVNGSYKKGLFGKGVPDTRVLALPESE